MTGMSTPDSQPASASLASSAARASRGFAAIIAACGAIGLASIAAMFAFDRGRSPAALAAHASHALHASGGAAAGGAAAIVGADERPADVPAIASEDYGRRLLAETGALIGPDHPDPRMRYSGTRMACGSCHLGTGTQPGTLSLLQTAPRYPRFSARDGGTRDLQDRINGCMTRSLNGRMLPRDGVEMLSMVAYIQSLSARYAAMDAGQRTIAEPRAFETPARAADLQAGEAVYLAQCARCHGADGAGLRATPRPIDGYVFPPLWGPDSFNNGAGMNRVLTAALFIKARMPLGAPTLTDDEAFDVAAYINAQPRPLMAHLEADYPDRATKPIDSGYGPYADEFPLAQHRFGPFPPISAHYKAKTAPRAAGRGDDAQGGGIHGGGANSDGTAAAPPLGLARTIGKRR